MSRFGGHSAEPAAAPSGEAAVPYSLALRMLGVAVILVLAGALVVWGADLGRRIGVLSGAEPQLSEGQTLRLLQNELTKLTVERNQLIKSEADAAVALQQTATQIKALELENSRLGDNIVTLEAQLAAEKRLRAGAVKKVRTAQH